MSLLRVFRTDPKGFFLQRPDGNRGWVNGIKGARLIPYRLKACGLVATTNPMGAGHWRIEYASFFLGGHVVVLQDNDIVGERHAQQVASSPHGIAPEVKALLLPGLPPKGDVSDWLAAGHTA